MTKKGFTLTELLIVSAIAGLIAAMILPALSRAGDDEKITICLDNLRKIGKAHHMYINDWDGYFVPYHAHLPSTANRWYRYFSHARYLPRGDVWYCPARQQKAWNDRMAYGYNMAVLGSSLAYREGDNTPARLDQLANPSHTLLTADSRRWLPEKVVPGYWDVGSYNILPYRMNDHGHPGVNHGKILNIGYADGGAGSVPVPAYDEKLALDPEGHDEIRMAPYDVLGEFWSSPDRINIDTPNNYWKR